MFSLETWYGIDKRRAAPGGHRETIRSQVGGDHRGERTAGMTDRGGDGPDTSVTADQRRAQMMAAALQVISERGFADTRIADVAERAGTSPALVIYYFK